MSKYNYTGEDKFRPISPWGYVGYSYLFAIPLVGFILLIIFSLSNENINRRNFARYYWCMMLIGIIITVVLSVVVGPAVFSFFSNLIPS